MAKPTGAFEAGEYGLPIAYSTGPCYFTEDDPCWLYLLFRLPLHPPWLCDSNAVDEGFQAASLLPQRIKVTQEVYLETAGQTIMSAGYTCRPIKKSWARTHTGVINHAWTTGDEDVNYQYDCLQYTPYNGAELPIVGVLELKIYGNNATVYDGADLEAVTLETVLDNAETDEVEWLSRDANKLYGADYPASSWMVADVLIGGYLHALADNRLYFCVPIAGQQLIPS
jgi:hypothetical protein